MPAACSRRDRRRRRGRRHRRSTVLSSGTQVLTGANTGYRGHHHQRRHAATRRRHHHRIDPDIANDGTLTFNRSNIYDTIANGNTISGSGGVVQAGIGTTIFGDGMTDPAQTANSLPARRRSAMAARKDRSDRRNHHQRTGRLRSTIRRRARQQHHGGRRPEPDRHRRHYERHKLHRRATSRCRYAEGRRRRYVRGRRARSPWCSATLDLAEFSQTIGALAGAGSVTLGSATLTTGGNASTTFSAIRGGGGGLIKAGNRPLLTGTNTYNGGTTINGGTLKLGAGSTSGSIQGSHRQRRHADVRPLRHLQHQCPRQHRQRQPASRCRPAPARRFSASGTTSLGRPTPSPACWQVGNGGSRSIGSGIVNDATLAINRTRSPSPTTSGAGGLTIGGGITTLSGADAYAGATNVDAGTLRAGAATRSRPPAVQCRIRRDAGSRQSQPTIGALAGAGSVTLGSATP